MPDKGLFILNTWLENNTGYLERRQHWIRGEQTALDTWLADRTGCFAKEDLTG
jgi:hypothetical protein